MTEPEKIDLYKKHKDEYVAKKKPVLVNIKPANYLYIEGQGEPGGDEFGRCIGALYSMAFTIKMTRKFAGLGDYVVCKLEAIWWDDEQDLCKTPMNEWKWAMMIRTPDCVKKTDLTKAVKALESKGKAEATDRVELKTIKEGQCVQMLHVGPYEKEPETIGQMQAFADEQGLEFCGKHREVYLSDPRRVPAERLKTILRHPVKKKG